MNAGRIRSLVAASMFALVAMAGGACGDDGRGSTKVGPCEEYGEESDECFDCMWDAIDSCEDRSRCGRKYEVALACMDRHGCDFSDDRCIWTRCEAEVSNAIDCEERCLADLCGYSSEYGIPTH